MSATALLRLHGLAGRGDPSAASVHVPGLRLPGEVQHRHEHASQLHLPSVQELQ